MSRPILRSFLYSLTLALTTPLLPIEAAAAGNAVDDLQQQQRAWLAGRTLTVSAPASVSRSASTPGSTGDAQELARQLLLGVSSHAPSHGVPEGRAAGRSRRYGDAQLLAQRLVAGRAGAVAGGS